MLCTTYNIYICISVYTALNLHAFNFTQYWTEKRWDIGFKIVTKWVYEENWPSSCIHCPWLCLMLSEQKGSQRTHPKNFSLLGSTHAKLLSCGKRQIKESNHQEKFAPPVILLHSLYQENKEVALKITASNPRRFAPNTSHASYIRRNQLHVPRSHTSRLLIPDSPVVWWIDGNTSIYHMQHTPSIGDSRKLLIYLWPGISPPVKAYSFHIIPLNIAKNDGVP